MENLMKSILTYLPDEYNSIIGTELFSIKTYTKPARDILELEPDSKGMLQSELLDWLPALVAVTFSQHVEDGKITTDDENEAEYILSLLAKADEVIKSFANKYKDERFVGMNSINFINEFGELLIRPLTEVEPNTKCYRMSDDPDRDENTVHWKYNNDPNWQRVAEFNPDLLHLSKNATAKALYWQNLNVPGLRIIPIDLLGEFHVLGLLADQCDELVKDLKKILTPECNQQEIVTLYSILETLDQEFITRLSKYNATVTSDDMHLATVQLAEYYAKLPAEIIFEFGPGCLCAPWAKKTI